MARGKSAREFALDLKRFGRVTRQQAEVIFRKIALELDYVVVLGTPVDTGRARGNWYPSIGAPSDTVDWESKGQAASIGRVTATVTSAKLGSVVWLTNNLPYILPLENGHSKQAPSGMVDLNLDRIAAKYGARVVRG